MRPQDIVILLKIISLGEKKWQLKDLARTLYISPSEISESLNRSKSANLVDYNKAKVNRQNLFEFIEYGLKYVFPQYPGTLTNGVPTAHSHPFMKKYFNSELLYVWPDSKEIYRGQSIEPLYRKQVDAIREDETLYKLLALIDVIRAGKTREINVAIPELKKYILNESSS